MSGTSRQAIVQSYRQLYRASLRAVEYSTPARYVVRDRLRRAFRESPASDFSPPHIANTIRFLNNAATDKGLEHKLVKTLCLVWGTETRHWQEKASSWHEKPRMGRPKLKWETKAYDNFYWCLRQLNESMGLCIR